MELIALEGNVSSNPGLLKGFVNANENSTISNNLHPTFSMKSKGLRVCHPNVKSLPCHLEEVQLLTCLNNLDFFAMNEN